MKKIKQTEEHKNGNPEDSKTESEINSNNQTADDVSNPGSDSDSIEMPRGHSLPNKTWRENDSQDEDSLFDDHDSDSPIKKGKKEDGAWQFKLTRDFRGEIE